MNPTTAAAPHPLSIFDGLYVYGPHRIPVPYNPTKMLNIIDPILYVLDSEGNFINSGLTSRTSSLEYSLAKSVGIQDMRPRAGVMVKANISSKEEMLDLIRSLPPLEEALSIRENLFEIEQKRRL